MLLGYEHKHKWELKEQITKLATNLNFYECECGATRDTVEPPFGEEMEAEEFYKNFK